MASGLRLRDGDVILDVGGVKFPCHRKVLATHSPYFEAMFSENFAERDKDIIEIQGVDSGSMEVLLDSAYRNRCNISDSNVLKILQASAMLQFENVQKTCIEFILQSLNIENCLQIMCCADELSLVSLYNKAKCLAVWEFSKVKKTEGFFELSIEALEKYLQSDCLNAQNEFEVFEAGVSWIEDEYNQRKDYISRMLFCVRFASVIISDLKTMCYFPCISENEDVLKIVECILNIKEGTDNQFADALRQSSDRYIGSNIHTENNTVSDRRSSGHGTNTIDEHSAVMGDSGDHGCCDSLNCCVFTESLTTSASYDPVPTVDNSDMHVQYTTETLFKAKQLLISPVRSFPMKPCVVGHVMPSTDEDNHSVAMDEKDSQGNSCRLKPYLICFEEESCSLVPFLHLRKVHQGPLEATGYKVIGIGKDIYVIGGEYLLGHGDWNKSVWKYDMARELWKFETSLQTPRRHHSVCCLNDYIYTIGGFGKHRVIMNDMEKYSIVNGNWVHCAALPHSLYSAACCVHKGKIFVIGSQVYCYHPELDMWSTMPEIGLPNHVGFNSAMSHSDWIYLTGNYSTELMRFRPDFMSLDSPNQAVESVGHFKCKAQNTCIIRDNIYSFSYEEEQLFVEVYNINTKKFQVLWKSSERDGVKDFCTKSCAGCFSLIKF